MKLYLMRHGQAARSDIDPQQGLTDAGKAEIDRLANRLAGQGICFDQVLHSEKTRAQQTAGVMANILAPTVAVKMRSGLKPNDNPAEWLPELEALDENTLIVSHLPFVPGLLAELTGTVDQVQGMGFVPGTIVCLIKQDSGWQLEWVESP